MDEQHPTTPAAPPAPERRRLSRLVSVGVIAGGLALVGGAVTAAALPSGSASAGPAAAASEAPATEAVVVPESYTEEQYEAFWGAGYGYADVLELADLWSTDEFSAKSRAGQLLLDGQPVPVQPSGPDDAAAPVGGPDDPQLDAFFAAGLDYEDAEALAELWQTDVTGAKARAGQLLLDGQPVPEAPASTQPS